MLEDDELFCHECGAKQEIEESAAPNEEAAPLEKKCIHCGETIEEDSAFCPYCGKSQVMEEVKEPEQEVKKEQVPEDTPEPKQEDNPAQEEKPKEAPVQETSEEQPPKYEWEEEPKSKKWIWILLILLLVGGGAWYFYGGSSKEKLAKSTKVEVEKTEDPVKINLDKEKEEMLSFLKDFYLHYMDENYLRKNVTETVLKKLWRDYPYNCNEGNCLATWVFSAYPHGTDMTLEEGPLITQVRNGLFDVDFKYSYINNGQKEYENSSVRIYVAKNNGRYKVVLYEYYDNSKAPRNDKDKLISVIPEGKYNLTLGSMHMILEVYDSIVKGEYYFQAGSSRDLSVELYGRVNNGLKLHLSQTAEVSRKNLGFMDGVFDGKTFKGEYDKDGYRENFEVYVNGD